MTRHIPCNLCESTECKFLFNAKDRLHGFEGNFSYVVCKNCGLVYMNPQVCPAEIVKFYPPDYAPHKAKAETKLRERHGVKKKLRKRPFIKPICDKLRQQLRLLDVGCGNGRFLNEIKTLTGCEVYGVDISANAAKAAREDYGIDIFTGPITESPFSDNFFDVITAWSCLEHVGNPSQVLLKISKILKNDGLCVISTPNFDSLNARLFKDKWYHLDCPRHLYLYTPKTIVNLLEKTGFVVTEMAYEKSSKGLLGSLQYYFYGDNFSPKHSDKIRRSSLIKALISPLTRITYLIRKSYTMIVLARKRRHYVFNPGKLIV